MSGNVGNFQNNPRVFAHDARHLITGGSFVNYTFGTTIEGVEVQGNGVCIYVGTDLDQLDVIMESGRTCKFNNLKAGMFLPVLVKAVNAVKIGGSTVNITNEGDLVALY